MMKGSYYLQPECASGITGMSAATDRKLQRHQAQYEESQMPHRRPLPPRRSAG